MARKTVRRRKKKPVARARKVTPAERKKRREAMTKAGYTRWAKRQAAARKKTAVKKRVPSTTERAKGARSKTMTAWAKRQAAARKKKRDAARRKKRKK